MIHTYLFQEPSKDTAEKADSQNRKEDNSPKAEDKGENLESSLWGVDDDELMQTLGLEDFQPRSYESFYKTCNLELSQRKYKESESYKKIS